VPEPVPSLPARPATAPAAAPAERFAARTAGMTASEIRALFAVASRPEVVSLAGGMPNLAALPLDSLATEVADLVAREGQVALQYGSAQGVPALREQICEVMALEGIRADPDDVVVTVGSQMALDLVTRILCDPGDVVLAEGPSYVGALGSFAAYQARVVHVAMDEHGLVPDLLTAALSNLATRGSCRSSCTRCRTSTTPPGSRCPSSGGPRCWRSARGTASRSSRTTPTGCSASPGGCTRRCGRWTAT
jgi:DNA-binding transcriptional MocR family regulator